MSEAKQDRFRDREYGETVVIASGAETIEVPPTPQRGARRVNDQGRVVEFDGTYWREPASGRIA